MGREWMKIVEEYGLESIKLKPEISKQEIVGFEYNLNQNWGMIRKDYALIHIWYWKVNLTTA